MHPSPRSHVSISLLLASVTLAGCFGKNQRVENPAELEHERYSVEFLENDEFELDDLPEAGDTGEEGEEIE